MSKKQQHCYDYPRPALTADVIVLTLEAKPQVLLIQRGQPPFEGAWALPGGFVNEGETLVAAARRELHEETGLIVAELEEVMMAGDPGRDPRGWVVSAVFLARVTDSSVSVAAADDARTLRWFSLARLPKLAFDHAAILQRVRQRWRSRIG
jgi:8-oxo-dGTP diphosphatase